MGLVTLVVCLVIQGVDVWSYTVHNITLDGPNTPLVFSSLPFFIQAPSTSHVNKVKDYPGSTMPNTRKINVTSLPIPTRVKASQAMSTSSGITQGTNISDHFKTDIEISDHFTNFSDVQRQSMEVEDFTSANNSQHIENTTISERIISSGNLSLLTPDNATGIRNKTFNSTTSVIPESMLITLGTVEYKQSNKTNRQSMQGAESDKQSVDLNDLTQLVRSKSDITKPFIYYRQTNKDNNNTSAGTVLNNETVHHIINHKNIEESHVCITKCPGSVVSIEMNIENTTQLCTGVLLVDNYVMTGGSCIPPDWRPWFASHPGKIRVRPLKDAFSIWPVKVRYYNAQGRPWPEQTDIIVLKVQTSGEDVTRSTFDPSRIYVEDSECYLYVYKDKNDTSVPSVRKLSPQDDYTYYYEEDYDQAMNRTYDLVKIRLHNLLQKHNRTVLGMNSSQLLFSVHNQPGFHYTSGVVFCDDSFDSLLYTSLKPRPSQPISVLVFLNLDTMFYHVNRFIFDFRSAMMELSTSGDYFNVEQTPGGAPSPFLMRKCGNMGILLATSCVFYFK